MGKGVKRRAALALATAGLFLTMTGWAAAKCQIGALEMRVRLEGHRAYVPGEINGRAVLFILDTGANVSILFSDAAAALQVPTHYMTGVEEYGVGGGEHANFAMVKDLKFDQARLVNENLLVSSGHNFAKSNVAGLLGHDMFADWDIDFDFKDNMVRLVRPSGCSRDQMVFWKMPYSQAPILRSSNSSATKVTVLLNGAPVQTELDTGAPVSIVTPQAAQSGGVTPNSPGVQAQGPMGGLGGEAQIQSWIATFGTFTLGDETIRNAKIRIAALWQHDKVLELGSRVPAQLALSAQMLLGWDFFMAHRVLVSQSQQMIYFSYLGGLVFDTARPAPHDEPPKASSITGELAPTPPRSSGG